MLFLDHGIFHESVAIECLKFSRKWNDTNSISIGIYHGKFGVLTKRHLPTKKGSPFGVPRG